MRGRTVLAVGGAADTLDVILGWCSWPEVEAREIVRSLAVVDHASARNIERTIVLGVAPRS